MKKSTSGKSLVKTRENSINYRRRVPKGTFKSEEDFLEVVGLWKNRKISLEQIRKKAWR